MDDHRAILKRVGLALIAIGVLDIAFMGYCIWSGRSYSSSFNIFAVLAGVFLFRDSLRAVRVVTWFAAFMLIGFIGISLAYLLLTPTALLLTEFRLATTDMLESLLLMLLTIAFLFWVYRQLRAAPVLAALAVAGRSAAAPRYAFVIGATLVVVLAGLLLFMSKTPSAAKAIELARAQYGNEYQYHVDALHWRNSHVSADLTAYNEHEIKPAHVEWAQ